MDGYRGDRACLEERSPDPKRAGIVAAKPLGTSVKSDIGELKLSLPKASADCAFHILALPENSFWDLDFLALAARAADRRKKREVRPFANASTDRSCRVQRLRRALLIRFRYVTTSSTVTTGPLVAREPQTQPRSAL